ASSSRAWAAGRASSPPTPSRRSRPAPSCAPFACTAEGQGRPRAMRSYISSFKAVFLALAAIVAIEASYAAVYAPTPVERSGYVNWNFNSPELFQKVVIYEKLASALQARPDVIQVGDSSGFHGIVPGIVDQYLGGLRYQ